MFSARHLPLENCGEGPAKLGTLFIDMPPGGDLFSHSVARAVSSALGRLTSVFGMGTGGAAPLEPPGSTSTSQVCTIFHKQATPEVGGNCSESRGRPHPSPLPGGVLRLSSNHPVIVAAAGIQRSICYLLPLPSSSPQRGSRALVVIHMVGEWSSCPGSRRASLLP